MNKILIAEDEPAIANLIRAALDGPDYRCTWEIGRASWRERVCLYV